MKLDDNVGTCFELSIAGYQFDDTGQKLSPFDGFNWLMVKGKIVRPEKSWTFLDPCLTTTELRTLAHWFKKISESPAPRVISFMEPNLRFRFDRIPIKSPGSPTGSPIESRISGMIHVIFTFTRAHHPGPKHTFPGFDELTFPILYNDPATIAAEMFGLASRFPPRRPAS